MALTLDSQASRRAVASPLATDAIFECPVRSRPVRGSCLVGVLAGEGIGREVTEAALHVLHAVAQWSGAPVDIEYGGAIGLPAVEASGHCLTDEVTDFCRSVFDRGGAILAGAGGGRFVYDLRKRFDLFCKLNPIIAWPEMERARIVKSEAARSTDLLVVRENVSGLYQGETIELSGGDGSRILEHRFRHSERDVRRFLTVAARIARQRRGNLAVVIKAGGLPDLSALWRDVAGAVAATENVACRWLDVDYACYLMLQEPRGLDVIAAPNCFADILSDLGGLLMGGRGLTFGASYGDGGEAVYQTNHGAAYDLQGTGKGNPLGQILSMGMMLRESFGLIEEAEAVEAAVRRVLGRGLCTSDIAGPGGTVVGTVELAGEIAAEIGTLPSPPR